MGDETSGLSSQMPKRNALFNRQPLVPGSPTGGRVELRSEPWAHPGSDVADRALERRSMGVRLYLSNFRPTVRRPLCISGAGMKTGRR
jgi:hypothetical protein